jgi:diketogulonate reductase-like aldo/keto reductase
MNVERYMEVRSRRVPTFIYGTAWKEDATARLTAQALAAGFRAIDTANQRRHYLEAGVGEAIGAAIARGEVTRGDLFLQTKFTYARGQDHRLPYDPRADVATQVAQSFASSLAHLGTDYVDSYVLHGPERATGLTAADHQAWRAMAALAAAGEARLVGVSNVSAEQLEELCATEEVRPAFVQNRCYAHAGWDRATRALCRREGIVYQGFSLLTANRHVMTDARLLGIAARLGATPEQTVFRFALEAGMLPLTGSSSADHLRQDLAVHDLPPLTDDERRDLEAIG